MLMDLPHYTTTYSAAMSTALLGRMEEAGQDGMVAKDLLDWYLTSDNYHVPGGGGSQGKEDVDGNEDAAAAAAAAVAEMKSQLMNVIRRMIKRDKSIVAVKTTVKGSKRIEDMLLKIPARPDAAGDHSNENNNELSVVGATEGIASSAISGAAVDSDQVANLRKQIEEKKAALLAKAAAQGGDDGNAKSDYVDDPSLLRK